MPSITYTDKATNSLVTPSDMNQIKSVVNAKADGDHRHDASDVDGLEDLVADVVADAVPDAPGGAEIVEALKARAGAERLGLESVRPIDGYRFLLISNEVDLSPGEQFIPSVMRVDTDAMLLSAVALGVNDELPAKMVVGTNFEVLVYDPVDQTIDINTTASPTSSQPITHTDIDLETYADDPFSIPAGTAMPFGLPFTPRARDEGAPYDFSSIWQWGVPTFTKRFRLRAVSGAGEGIWSDWQAVTIDQSTSYYLGDSAWDFEEDRAASASANGLTLTSISPSRVVPDGWSLYAYAGPLPYNATNAAAIEAAARAIVPGGTLFSTASATVGTALFAMLFLKSDDSVFKHPASSQKQLTVQGRYLPGAPTMVDAPVQTGNGKISGAQSVSNGTWTGTPTSYTYQWYLGTTAISTGGNASTYTPGANADMLGLWCRVGAVNAGGTTYFDTAPVTITYAAPTVAAALSAQSFSQVSGAYRSIDISGVFAGSGLTIEVVNGPTVTGVPVCSVNMTDMTLGIAVSSALAATAITLRASNSGGSVTSTFSLAITAGTAAPVPVFIGPVAGSNTSGVVAYTDYLADDALFALIIRASGGGFTKPDLAAWSGQYDWTLIDGTFLTVTGLSVGLYVRRCNGNGTDGALGDWNAGLTGSVAMPTYFKLRGVNWADPIGTIAAALKVSGINLDHPGLTTIEGANSVVISVGAFVTAQTGQQLGQRPGITDIVVTGAGARKRIGISSVNPVTTWAAADDVPHEVVTDKASGAQFVAAFEVKGGAGASTITFPDPIPQADITVTEVTDPAVATAQGFSGVSGRLKTVLTSARAAALTQTIGSDTWTLCFELGANEVPAPPNSAKVFDSTKTEYYSISSLAKGVYAYPRVWWRRGTGANAVFRLAWSGAPILIQGLSGGTPTGTLPAIPSDVTGTANNALKYKVSGKDFYIVPAWGSPNSGEGYDLTTALGIRGPAFAVAAYASFTGDTSTDAMALQHFRAGLTSGTDVSLICGYGAQHDTGWFVAAYWIKNTPRLWNGTASAGYADGLSPTERAKVELLCKAGLVANAATMRYDRLADPTTFGSTNWRCMNGVNNNPSTYNSNPNVRCAPRYNLLVIAAFMGGTQIAKDYLDSIVAVPTTGKVSVRSIYDALVDAGLTNAADSFKPSRPSGAPTYADIQARCNGWSSKGFTLIQPNSLWAEETAYTFDLKVALTGGENVNTTARHRSTVLGTASSALTALIGSDGMCHEFDTTDTAAGLASANGLGDRSSAEYGMWAIRLPIIATPVLLHAGIISRTNASVIAAMNRFKIGIAHFKELTRDTVGWDSYAQGGAYNSSKWYWTNQTLLRTLGYRWGILPFFAMAEAGIAIFDNSALSHTLASYYDNNGGKAPGS